MMLYRLLRGLLSAAFVLLSGLVPRIGIGQALIGFRPTTLSVTPRFLGPHPQLVVAHRAALDSLSRRYGISVDTQRTYPHTFILEEQVAYTPNLQYPSRFQYTHTAVLRDAAGQREVYRAETILKDLADLVQHPQALHLSFRQTDGYVFRFLAGYGTPPPPAPGRVLQVVFAPSPPSAGGEGVQQVVEEVFARNQGKLGYRLLDAHTTTEPEHIVHVTLVPTASEGFVVMWKLSPDEHPQYQGKPIPTTFAVSAADLTRGDFSFLMAKMTASLIKLLN
jgi:hypothetical protein